jgi:hypothetical protein
MEPPAPNTIPTVDDIIFSTKKSMVSAMKKILILGVVLMTMLVSLGGCCWPRHWHDDGYGRGRHGYGYDNYRGGGYHERR